MLGPLTWTEAVPLLGALNINARPAPSPQIPAAAKMLTDIGPAQNTAQLQKREKAIQELSDTCDF